MMNFNDIKLRNDEKATFELREIFRKYGYTHYKVSKFEEYDLYVRNKSFLQNESILTFTDTNGKLMALKPDVTLSIIKNATNVSGAIQKLYYSENVYRVPSGSHEYKEIMQTGLECIGEVDMYSMCEVIMLAKKSLEIISEDCVLNISNLAFISALLGEVDEDTKRELLALISEKNIPSIKTICQEKSIRKNLVDKICTLTSLYCPLSSALDTLENLIENSQMQTAFDELKQIEKSMKSYGIADKIYVDFSIINDMNYYNGIVFQGFVNGISSSVLSGGRYDNLLAKMGKSSQAIGFAVYLDLLERFGEVKKDYDVDVLLVYNDAENQKVQEAMQGIIASGKTVKAQKSDDNSIKYREKQEILGGKA